jgi:hypothetical protein
MVNKKNLFFLKRAKKLRIYKKTTVIVLVLVLTIGFSFFQIARAADLTALSDTMSSQKDSAVSNHTIKFSTPTGAGDVTDTIVITFPTGFTIGSVDYTDIDLSHGASTGYETEETLAAAADGTSWGASFAGRVLTLTHPTNAANGDISSNDKIVVEIGLNASGGNAQITNPTAGTYLISIAGLFGDTGSIAVAVITDDQVVVSMTVDPYISFTLSQNSVTLTKSGGGNPDYQNTGFNNGTANTLAASTNGVSGYTITYSGATLTGGGHTIDAMASKTTSSTGTEQFGLNLKNNATPDTGAEPSGGSGSPASDYNTADQFRYIANTTTSLASASAPTTSTTYTASYIVNVSQTTESGAYSTTITYSATGNF